MANREQVMNEFKRFEDRLTDLLNRCHRQASAIAELAKRLRQSRASGDGSTESPGRHTHAPRQQSARKDRSLSAKMFKLVGACVEGDHVLGGVNGILRREVAENRQCASVRSVGRNPKRR